MQSDSVRAVLARNRPAMDSLWHTMAPRFDTLRASIRAQIRRYLTPAQQTKYVDLMIRYDAWRERKR
jgi:Spy/CpxP family protein refolding chaperone